MTTPPLSQPSSLAPWPAVEPDPAGVGELVRWAAQHPLRTRWEREQLPARYCRRSPARILEQHAIHYSAPCADLSSLVAVGLHRLGLRPTLVLGGIRRPLRSVKFQAGLELELSGETWVIGFGVSRTYFYQGQFLETRRRPWVVRRSPEALDPQRSFLEWFLPEGLDGLHTLIPGYDLAADLRWHQRRNNALLFALARRKAAREARAPRPATLAGAQGLWSRG